ncbi:hypothetical protein AB6I73_003851 [Citrobacter amalonaticus]|nr:hypothetical protein [Citrobacter amalonaticus]
MSNYSCLSLLKTKAKKLARAQGIKQTQALEIIAKEAKFATYHELSEVAKRDPLEPRLVLAALGETNLSDAMTNDDVFSALDYEIGEMLAGEIADTNAEGFYLEFPEEAEVSYDEATGVLSVKASMEYQGEQDPDRPYSGTTFYIDATFDLVRRDDKWSLVEDSLELTDVNLDTELESHYLDY